MTQVKYVNNPAHKLARVLGNLAGQGSRKWEPSREEMIRMRQCSRAGYSLTQAYEDVKPSCTKEIFRRRSKDLCIRWSEPTKGVSQYKR